MHGVDLFMM